MDFVGAYIEYVFCAVVLVLLLSWQGLCSSAGASAWGGLLEEYSGIWNCQAIYILLVCCRFIIYRTDSYYHWFIDSARTRTVIHMGSNLQLMNVGSCHFAPALVP